MHLPNIILCLNILDPAAIGTVHMALTNTGAYTMPNPRPNHVGAIPSNIVNLHFSKPHACQRPPPQIPTLPH